MSNSVSRGYGTFSPLCIVLSLFAVLAATGGISRGEIITAIDAKSSLSNAGRTVLRTADGRTTLFPVGVDLLPGDDRWIEFPSVTGSVKAGPGWPVVGPDGGSVGPGGTYGTNIFDFNGISGILANRFLFLAGVFLTDDAPLIDTAPVRLDFRSSAIGIDFQDLTPVIHQSFFIGDGRTSTGELQRFYVPEEATRLFLGFIDSDRFGWPDGGRLPSAYWDNTGSLQAALEVRSVPEPSLLVNLGILGSMSVLWHFRRKTAVRTMTSPDRA